MTPTQAVAAVVVGITICDMFSLTRVESTSNTEQEAAGFLIGVAIRILIVIWCVRSLQGI